MAKKLTVLIKVKHIDRKKENPNKTNHCYEIKPIYTYYISVFLFVSRDMTFSVNYFDI